MPEKPDAQVLSELGAATESLMQYCEVVFPDRGIRTLALLYTGVGETARMIPKEEEARVKQLMLDNIDHAWQAAVETNEDYRKEEIRNAEG